METEAKLPPVYHGMGIHARLHAVMERIGYIQKEQPKKGADGGLRYSILNYNSLVRKVRPLLVEYGVMVYPVEYVRFQQNGNRTEIEMMVRFVCVDEPGAFIDVPSAGFGVDQQDKGPGKSRTYCIKSALRDVLLLESGDDPDDDQSSAANHSTVDPAIAAQEKLEANAAKQNLAQRKKLYAVAKQNADAAGRTEADVKGWLQNTTNGLAFADIPLDMFDQCVAYFESLIPENAS